jgi:hypothetical protein
MPHKTTLELGLGRGDKAARLGSASQLSNVNSLIRRLRNEEMKGSVDINYIYLEDYT